MVKESEPPIEIIPVPHRRVPTRKADLRKEYRRGESKREADSVSLAIAYPRLRSLLVDLTYFDGDLVSWGQGLKYRANLAAAKSMLQFNCPSRLCKGGDFELTHELRKAIAQRKRTLSGELRCRGARDHESGRTIPCESVLRYKMILTFKTRFAAKRSARIRL